MYKHKYQSKMSFCYHLEDRNFGLGGLSYSPNTGANTVQTQIQIQSKYRCKYSPNTGENTA